MNLAPLTESTLATFTTEICRRDPDLALVVAKYGLPPLWDRAEGFATLTHIILEQQVSLASAKAVFERLCAICPPEPASVLAFGVEGLRSVGITRQKARYIFLAAEGQIGRAHV